MINGFYFFFPPLSKYFNNIEDSLQLGLSSTDAIKTQQWSVLKNFFLYCNRLNSEKGSSHCSQNTWALNFGRLITTVLMFCYSAENSSFY